MSVCVEFTMRWGDCEKSTVAPHSVVVIIIVDDDDDEDDDVVMVMMMMMIVQVYFFSCFLASHVVVWSPTGVLVQVIGQATVIWVTTLALRWAQNLELNVLIFVSML